MKYVVVNRSFRKLERAMEYARKLVRKYGRIVEIEKYETREQEREWLRGKIICRIEPTGKEYWFA